MERLHQLQGQGKHRRPPPRGRPWSAEVAVAAGPWHRRVNQGGGSVILALFRCAGERRCRSVIRPIATLHCGCAILGGREDRGINREAKLQLRNGLCHGDFVGSGRVQFAPFPLCHQTNSNPSSPVQTLVDKKKFANGSLDSNDALCGLLIVPFLSKDTTGTRGKLSRTVLNCTFIEELVSRPRQH